MTSVCLWLQSADTGERSNVCKIVVTIKIKSAKGGWRTWFRELKTLSIFLKADTNTQFVLNNHLLPCYCWIVGWKKTCPVKSDHDRHHLTCLDRYSIVFVTDFLSLCIDLIESLSLLLLDARARRSALCLSLLLLFASLSSVLFLCLLPIKKHCGKAIIEDDPFK